MTLHAPNTIAPLQPQNPAEPASGTAEKISRRKFFVRLRRDDSGQDLIEYALAAALIGLASVATMNDLADHIARSFDHISHELIRAIPDGDHHH